MRSFKRTLLVVISGGLVMGLLGMAHAAPAGSINNEIIIADNIAKDVIDTGGIAFGVKGLAKKLIGTELRVGNPNKSETVVQGVRYEGNLPAARISITGNTAEKIVNMGGRLNVQGVTAVR